MPVFMFPITKTQFSVFILFFFLLLPSILFVAFLLFNFIRRLLVASALLPTRLLHVGISVQAYRGPKLTLALTQKKDRTKGKIEQKQLE